MTRYNEIAYTVGYFLQVFLTGLHSVPEKSENHSCLGVVQTTSIPLSDGSKISVPKKQDIGHGHPTFNRNPHNGYINSYYWVDDHPLLYGNNGSLDPTSTSEVFNHPFSIWGSPFL